MIKREICLLKTLMRSSGPMNRIKYAKGKKEKSGARNQLIASVVFKVMLIGYAFLESFGYSYTGLGQYIPAITALLLTILEFVMTIFRANAYLFGYKGFDMLMAMPFKTKEVLMARFLQMYLRGLEYDMCIAIPVLIGYGIGMRPPAYVYPVWIVLSLFLPMIPMVAATVISALIAAVGSRFRQKSLAQTALLMGFSLVLIFAPYVFGGKMSQYSGKEVLTGLGDAANKIGAVYLPIRWFSDVILEGQMIVAPVIVVLSAAAAVLFVEILAPRYKAINSRLSSGRTGAKKGVSAGKMRSPVQAIAFKEFRRMFSSSHYAGNILMGELMAIVVGIVVMIIGADRFMEMVVKGGEMKITVEMLQPAVPFFIYMTVCMMSSTSCSLSLEGKSFWILKSLPIDMKSVCNGKVLFQVLLAVPAFLISMVLCGIGFKMSFSIIIMCCVMGIALCWFNAELGMVLGIHFLKLDWENEIEVIKQGTATVLSVLPNMLVTMAMMFGSVFLRNVIPTPVVVTAVTLLAAAAGILLKIRVDHLAKSLSAVN